jgi:DNA polymerase III subunit epsilon
MSDQMKSGRIASLGQTSFAVVDVETTGIYADSFDRIVEIAIVRITPDGTIHDEFATLLNPGRDIGPTNIHGITASDVIHAPTFQDVAGDIAILLDDAVVVGHQLRFDLSFLTAEFTRIGATLPHLPSLCTMDLAFKFLPEIPSRKLSVCCEEAGIQLGDAHQALCDAQATAQLLAFYLDQARQMDCLDLRQLGCECMELPSPEWIAWPPSGRCLHRTEAQAKLAQERGYLARLVDCLPGDDATDATQAEYLALLDRVLQDRRITTQEAEALLALASSWGLSKADVKEAHLRYLSSLVSEAKADGIVTQTERADIDAVAQMLGFEMKVVNTILSEQAPIQTASKPSPDESFSGKSVCFTGALAGTIGSEIITREIAEDLARRAGLDVHPRVTKKLDLLVVADPNTMSSKAKKAHEYGTRIIAESVFWRALGVPVD